jgi:hypothetical protein
MGSLEVKEKRGSDYAEKTKLHDVSFGIWPGSTHDLMTPELP